MLRLYFILITSILLSASSAVKSPTIMRSTKVTYNGIVNQTIAEGNVRINFEDYFITTQKFIVTTYKDEGKLKVESFEFPVETRVIKNDKSEVFILPNAYYDLKDSVVKSNGKIYIEKEGKLFSTTEIEIKLGQYKGLEYLKW